MSDFSSGHAAVHMSDNHDGIACVRVIGEIDIAVASALDAALAGITAVPRPAVYVDLAAVRFADSTLVHFLCRLVRAMPHSAPVLLCRPNYMTRLLAELCSLQNVATITANLPSDFSSGPWPTPDSVRSRPDDRWLENRGHSHKERLPVGGSGKHPL